MSQGDNQTQTITLKNSEFIPHIIKLLEEGSPDMIFNHPQNPRLQDFLAKVL